MEAIDLGTYVIAQTCFQVNDHVHMETAVHDTNAKFAVTLDVLLSLTHNGKLVLYLSNDGLLKVDIGFSHKLEEYARYLRGWCLFGSVGYGRTDLFRRKGRQSRRLISKLPG